MFDRRTELRLAKDLDCVIFRDSGEYEGRIVDISKEGIAVESDSSLQLEINDCVYITICEEFFDKSNEKLSYANTVQSIVKNVSDIGNGKIRFGCVVHDVSYQDYLQEQYVAYACALLSNAD